MKRILPIAILSSLFFFEYRPQTAEACGCVHPPIPDPALDENYAINQQGEAIIFEVDEEKEEVTAHVLIKYAGEPENFAWMLPIPNVVDLGISEPTLFGLLDSHTTTVLNAINSNLCPSPEYICEFDESCYDDAEDDGGFDSDSGGSFTAPGDEGDTPEGIEVELQTTVGDYEVVVFKADESKKAVDWLQDNNFIVNDSMAPFMQPYLDANMMFLAAKLVAGAGADSIKPLRMTYSGKYPMIPLQLTAVTAEPHMPVLSYIYADSVYKADGHPSVNISADDLTFQTDLRTFEAKHNFPAVLSKAIDEAGGDGFFVEYSSTPPHFSIDDPGDCCKDPNVDACFIAGDGICQCPRSEFDRTDCEEFPGLLEGISQMDALAEKHGHLTRILTQLSPEDMTFDPVFVPDSNDSFSGRRELDSTAYFMRSCRENILDSEKYLDIIEFESCSMLYCGEGKCAVDESGRAGCVCESGYVARRFTELDGSQSVTCVPESGIVDLGADHELPNGCEGISCGEGECVDVGGFPSCKCQTDQVATLVSETDGETIVTELLCVKTKRESENPGAINQNAELKELKVCAPAPRDCGPYGWLVKNENIQIQGEICEHSLPEPEQVGPPDELPCDEEGGSNEDASSSGSSDNGDGEDSKGTDGADTQGADDSESSPDARGCSCKSTDASPPIFLSLFTLIGILRLRKKGLAA